MKKPSIKVTAIATIAAVAFAIGIWAGIRGKGNANAPIIQDTVMTVLPQAKRLQPFHLEESSGQPFELDNLKGKNTLIFFGYTSCPDVCPTTMYQLKKLDDLFVKSHQENIYQVVFVSIDPRRDTPKVLEKYVHSFNKHFIGVTGKRDDIQGLAKQLGASYDVEDDGKSKNYAVSHTDVIFVINSQGEFAAILTAPHDASRIETRLNLLAQVEQRNLVH